MLILYYKSKLAATQIPTRSRFYIIFQQYKESDEAQRYLTFYPITEWPHVTVIDPRTGEKLITWNHLDSASFCDLVSTFLEAHPKFDENEQNGSAPKRKRQRSVSLYGYEKVRYETYFFYFQMMFQSIFLKIIHYIYLQDDDNIIDADEDDQLAAAIKASLAESQKPSNSDSFCESIKSRLADTYTETPSDSDLEVYSGDDSNLSTPVKKMPTSTEIPEQTENEAQAAKNLLKNGK